MDTPTILKQARGYMMKDGVTATAYEDHAGRCCFIGAINKAEENLAGNSNARFGRAHRYVIDACKSLLPGWDHDIVTNEIYQNAVCVELKLAEAVLYRACSEAAGEEIAEIVMTRAIKLAQADLDKETINRERYADEAEMIAQGAEREADRLLHLELMAPNMDEILSHI
jgi:hypothetical protein